MTQICGPGSGYCGLVVMIQNTLHQIYWLTYSAVVGNSLLISSVAKPTDDKPTAKLIDVHTGWIAGCSFVTGPCEAILRTLPLLWWALCIWIAVFKWWFCFRAQLCSARGLRNHNLAHQRTSRIGIYKCEHSVSQEQMQVHIRAFAQQINSLLTLG